MVNTFLVSNDFRISASKLDYRRLGKQRVEAYQILIILSNLRLLANLFNIPDFPSNLDTPKEDRKSWIAHVMTTFKQSGISCIHVRDNINVIYTKDQISRSTLRSAGTGKNDSQLPHKLQYNLYVKDDICYEIKGNNIIWSGPWYDCVLPGERLIKSTGFMYHPAVCMWLGFENSLKEYINAHIDEWISRGYVNNMNRYEMKGSPQPCWCKNKQVIDNFKVVLIEREITRSEPLWYLHQQDFIEVYFGANSGIIQERLVGIPNKKWDTYISKDYLLSLGLSRSIIWS